jgi:NifU-like protein involved in Fe-S cluster formation/uncharacterized protein (DUF4213/DUF364 family)
MAYVDKVLEHFANPRNIGPIPAADGVGLVGDPACGDVFKAWIRVRDGRIERAAFKVMGCPAAIATGSMMTVLARDRTLDEALALTDDDIVRGLDELPEFKLHCSNSAAGALHAAVDDYLDQAVDAGGTEMSTVLEKLRQRFGHLCSEYGLLEDSVEVQARELTPEQAIGHPDHDDYPVLTGHERMIEAEFRGAKGQAFTSRPGGFSGTLAEVVGMQLTNNYRSAVLVAVVNAVCAYLAQARRAVHCRNADMVECAKDAAEFLRKRFDPCIKVFLVGLQPRLLEALAKEKEFEVRLTDLGEDLRGTKKAGVLIEPPEAASSCMDWCDVIFATGSTIANGTADELIESGKPLAFYGVTCAGPAALLDLERFCPLGR